MVIEQANHLDTHTNTHTHHTHHTRTHTRTHTHNNRDYRNVSKVIYTRIFKYDTQNSGANFRLKKYIFLKNKPYRYIVFLLDSVTHYVVSYKHPTWSLPFVGCSVRSQYRDLSQTVAMTTTARHVTIRLC